MFWFIFHVEFVQLKETVALLHTIHIDITGSLLFLFILNSSLVKFQSALRMCYHHLTTIEVNTKPPSKYQIFSARRNFDFSFCVCLGMMMKPAKQIVQSSRFHDGYLIKEANTTLA